MEAIVFLVVVVFFSSLINSIFGFGFALFCMPLLSLYFGLNTLGPLIPLLFLSGSMFIVFRGRKQVQLQKVLPIIISAGCFIPLGIYLGKYGNEMIIKIALGVFIISFSLYSLLVSKPPPLKSDKWALAAGAISGLFGGAYNITGPPIVIYGTMRQWNPQTFRLTLQACFLCLTLIIIGSHIISGSYQNTAIFTYFLYAFPSLILAIPIGKKINLSIQNPQKFNKYVYILMTFSGTMLIIRAIGIL